MDADAHVWLEDVAMTARTERYAATLSRTEHDRMARFHFDRDRRSFLVAHGLARAALSWCEPAVPPDAWRFGTGPHGRPEVVAPVAGPALRFNLSHTAGRVAVVVARSIDCGIDVETTDRDLDVTRLARRVLAPAEFATLAAQPDAARPALFFRYWTLKEAYLKARGTGLTLPLDSVRFDLTRRAIGVQVAPELRDRAVDWQFAQWTPTAGDTVAVALRRGTGPDRRVVLHSPAESNPAETGRW